MNKKIILLYIMIYICAPIYSDKRFYLIKDKISIIKSEKIIMDDDIPKFKDYEQVKKLINKKYVLKYGIIKEEDLRKSHPYSLSEELNELMQKKEKLDDKDFASILKSNRIVLSDYYPMGDLLLSVTHIKFKSRIIGEKYFAASSDGQLAPMAYSFSANIIIDNAILSFNLSYFDYDQDIPKKTKYFYGKPYGVGYEYFWKSINTKMELYNDIISENNKEEISELILLYKYFEEIINTLSFTNTEGILNDSRVRIRKEPNLESEQIGYLSKNQKVLILEETEEKMKIDDMEAVWYKIQTDDGIIGWAYGWFIDVLEE